MIQFDAGEVQWHNIEQSRATQHSKYSAESPRNRVASLPDSPVPHATPVEERSVEGQRENFCFAVVEAGVRGRGSGRRGGG